MFNPVVFHKVSFSFQSKDLFSDFFTIMYPGSRVAITGRNGSGKSTLLKLLSREILPSSGSIEIGEGLSVGIVEQTVDEFKDLSGGQRFNKRLSEALAKNPDILLLDEPTNHLDRENRKSLMQMIGRFEGTVIAVSHDKEFLSKCMDVFWHIEEEKIHEFTGDYNHFLEEKKSKKERLLKALNQLQKEKAGMHGKQMKEQKRASKSQAKGKKSIKERKWPTVVSNAKMRRSQETAGKKKKAIDTRRDALQEEMDGIHLGKVITPHFILENARVSSGTLLTIHDGSVGYDSKIVEKISLTLYGGDRIAIEGSNGSGKSTLLKAILGDESVNKMGSWYGPKRSDIGYLDQHYNSLDEESTPLEQMEKVLPDPDQRFIRRQLSNFLFYTNEEVTKKVKYLSGGEKVRLTLCMLAASPKELLILDEITNNLDMETKDHVTEVLREYPGAMIVISHEENFLKEIGGFTRMEIKEGRLIPTS